MIDEKITKFEDMPVWNDAISLAVLVYEITKQFPKEEQFSLTSQIRRAATSISANIAEGFGRKTIKDKLHFYVIAYGSLLEVKNFVYLSTRLDFITESQQSSILDLCVSLQKQINAIMRHMKESSS